METTVQDGSTTFKSVSIVDELRTLKEDIKALQELRTLKEEIKALHEKTTFKLLWERADTGANDFGERTIPLDLSKYNYILLICKVRYQLESQDQSSGFVGYTPGTLLTTDGKVYQVFSTSWKLAYKFYRDFSATKTGLYCTKSHWSHGSETSWSSGNDAIIPFRIYGVPFDII